MLAHLAGIAGYFGGILQYVAPLVIYIIYKDKSKFVAFHALQSLFFQLAVLVVLSATLVIGVLTCIGWLLIFPLAALALVYCIVAAIKAYGGDWFQYWLVGGWARKTVGM